MTSGSGFRIRIREAQEHVDPDPDLDPDLYPYTDPQHWLQSLLLLYNSCDGRVRGGRWCTSSCGTRRRAAWTSSCPGAAPAAAPAAAAAAVAAATRRRRAWSPSPPHLTPGYQVYHRGIWRHHCSGSGPGSGSGSSEFFWASWIRIYLSKVRIRIWIF